MCFKALNLAHNVFLWICSLCCVNSFTWFLPLNETLSVPLTFTSQVVWINYLRNKEQYSNCHLCLTSVENVTTLSIPTIHNKTGNTAFDKCTINILIIENTQISIKGESNLIYFRVFSGNLYRWRDMVLLCVIVCG